MNGVNRIGCIVGSDAVRRLTTSYGVGLPVAHVDFAGYGGGDEGGAAFLKDVDLANSFLLHQIKL